MEAIISLENEFLIQPDGTSIPSEIMNNKSFYPYFKDSIGAIDGTHVRVKISNSNAPSIDPDEELIAEVDRELLNSRRRPRRNAINEDTEEGKNIRDNIAAQMWNAYVL
uniref:DDE Tnp4 domain-containing protein n=1 Tax=Chenopodium quinoa TaxID=63459 RepID=A0A803N8A2_CHEQI